jgi:hypothetical protein
MFGTLFVLNSLIVTHSALLWTNKLLEIQEAFRRK